MDINIIEYQKGEIIDNRYLVNKIIGGGGFGKVLSVIDQNTTEEVALKYCTSISDEDIRRFKREVRIMENIDHENVIGVLNSNTEHAPPYFTMPKALYSVADIITDLQGNVDRIIAVFESICKGIIAIHNSGHTHRDIKPDNVLVFDQSQIKVSDLGLAKFDERNTTILTRASIYMGTYAYMPPEQMTYGGTRDLDHVGDVYQLGKTLYHLLTGNYPTVLDPSAVPIAIWYVIQKATRDSPEKRYQSVNELLDALHDAIRTTDPAMNTKGLIEELLISITEELKSDRYDSKDVTKLLQIMYSTEDEEDFIEQFHRIPLRILQIYSSNLVIDFEPVMDKYKGAIDSVIGGYPFAFAEGVANRMRTIFANSSSPDIKKNALLSILMAGNRLNRWAAMGDFDDLLKNISDDVIAYSVADGLREQLYDYKRLYNRIPKKELHPAIQVVWELCEKQQEEDI